MTTVLVAEHEPRIATIVATSLAAHGYSVSAVADGLSALRIAREQEIDLVVLDSQLPQLDGFAVLRSLRSRGITVPAVFLTSRRATNEAAIDNGRNAFLARPFRLEALLTAVRDLLTLRQTRPSPVLSYGNLSLDLRSRRARIGSYTVDLSARECALAEVFLRHPGQILNREFLLRQVWSTRDDLRSNVVDVYVRYLRRKLGADRFAAHRGRGYQLLNV